MLSCYNCLEGISDAIDKIVVSQGIGSGKNGLTTLYSAEKMINLMQRKKTLINLKIIIENTMEKLSVENVRLLALKYFDRVSAEECIKIMEISRRTYFRKFDKAIESF